ncbi:MAG TPA: polysaccharide biosynthesis/export family protein, partial [Lacipirellulaceae bacterium]
MRRAQNAWRRWFVAALVAVALVGVRSIGAASEGEPDFDGSANADSAVALAELVAPQPIARAAIDDGEVQLCQALGPAAPYAIWGVDSATGHCGYPACSEVGWDARGCIPWQEFAQGEYVGHARTPHVPEYRLREGDVLAVYYRRTREELSRPYELQVGDRIRIESLTAGAAAASGEAGNAGTAGDDISRELVIQPDGSITLPLVGEVRATRRSLQSLRDELEERYTEFFREPTITVTPIAVNTKLEDLLDTVDSRAGTLGGRQLSVKVTPAGDVQLPGLGSVFVQGLTLSEAKQEIDARYDTTVPGVQVTLVLVERAPRFIYVMGEVGQPGRFAHHIDKS